MNFIYFINCLLELIIILIIVNYFFMKHFFSHYLTIVKQFIIIKIAIFISLLDLFIIFLFSFYSLLILRLNLGHINFYCIYQLTRYTFEMKILNFYYYFQCCLIQVLLQLFIMNLKIFVVIGFNYFCSNFFIITNFTKFFSVKFHS